MTNSGSIELDKIDADTPYEVRITYQEGRGVLVYLELSESYLTYDTETDSFEGEITFSPSPQVCCARCDTHKQKDKQWYKILDKSIFYGRKQQRSNTMSGPDEIKSLLCPNCYAEIKTRVKESLHENSHKILSETI